MMEIGIADDTDILKSSVTKSSNVLFVLDLSRSMRLPMSGDQQSTPTTRMSSVVKALRTTLNDPSLTDINVGISSFSGELISNIPDVTKNQPNKDWANGITYPISPIDSDANTILNKNVRFTHDASSYLPSTGANISTRKYISESIMSVWEPIQRTPIVDALYEAALYFRGMDVKWGNHPPSEFRSAHPSTYSGSDDFFNPPTYISPITDECTSNTIVLMTDGRPKRNSSIALTESLIGKQCTISTARDDGKCGPDIAKFLAETDNNPSVSGKQTVNLHAVGVDLDESIKGVEAKKYLKNLVTHGGGEFFNANDTQGLTDALKQTIQTAQKQAHSFTSSTYVPDLSSVLHSDEFVYIPVFDVAKGAVWPGNIKKYKRLNGKLIDADGKSATDKMGNLKQTARDFWGASTPSNIVKSGGVANKLLSPSRRLVYTDAGVTNYPYNLTANQLHRLNTNVNKKLLGNSAMSNNHRTALINFIRGEAADKATRHHIGDILHSKPFFIAYKSKKVIFVGTNEGYLHAFNADSGKEVFAYMPSELLKNIESQYSSNISASHQYGVDGSFTLSHDDLNGNRRVDGDEKAYLYFGLRRGGKAYYALDITNPNSPKLAWKISNKTPDYENLGFTWSKPTIANMSFNKDGGKLKNSKVLIFGGGYIDDNNGERDNTKIASDVYIVDASDGQLIWKTPNYSLSHAVAGGVRALDIDGDGSIERLYFADTDGNVWRVKLKSGDITNSSNQTVEKFAALGSLSNKRAFFTEPDISLVKNNGKLVIALAIGSGTRPNPLDTNNKDKFFVLFDENISHKSTSRLQTITLQTLVNVSKTPSTNTLSSGKKGWYKNLNQRLGEKVFSDALTYSNMVLFHTLSIDASAGQLANSCETQNKTDSNLYALNLFTGGAILDLDNSGDINKTSDQSKYISSGNILGSPQVVYKPITVSSNGSATRPIEIMSGNASSIKLTGQSSIKKDTKSLKLKDIHKVYWFDKY